MSVIPLKGLSAEESAVQERAILLLKSERVRLMREYRSSFKNLVGTDQAREIFPEYAQNIDSRRCFAAAVQRPSAALADLVFEEIASELDGGIVIFTGGGTGAGKTTSILRDGAVREHLSDAGIICDGNFNSFKTSKSKIELVLNRGCKVIVVFVHRHPVAAYIKGVLPRAMEHGRTVPIAGHLRMHKDSIAAFLKAHRYFAANSNVSFVVLNNTGHEQESFRSTVDYLKAVKYDSPVLEDAIRKGLDNELSEKRITEALYRASCGTPCT